MKELEKLVSTIQERCSFEPAGFNREGIKQHILDVFNERRRRRKGHDYNQVSIFVFSFYFVRNVDLKIIHICKMGTGEESTSHQFEYEYM